MNKKLFRWTGIYLLLDGLLTLLFGRSYYRLYRFGKHSSPYRRAFEWLLKRPSWLLRGTGALGLGLGLAVLNQAPIDVQTFYKWVARGYAAIDPGYRKWFYPQAHLAFDQALSNYLPKGGAVLDLGCGGGANLGRLLALQLPYGSYTGVDLTAEMLEQAKKRYAGLPHVSFQQLDLMSDPFPVGSFDLIISTWVFEHLLDPVLAAEKAFTLLKPGRHMVLLFEDQSSSLKGRMIEQTYSLINTHLVREVDYRRFPGTVLTEQHFSGPVGDIAILVLEKPGLNHL